MLSSAILESIAEGILENCAKTLSKQYILGDYWHDILISNIRLAANMQANMSQQGSSYRGRDEEKDLVSYTAFLDSLSRLVHKKASQIDLDIMRCLAHECACLISLSSR